MGISKKKSPFLLLLPPGPFSRHAIKGGKIERPFCTFPSSIFSSSSSSSSFSSTSFLQRFLHPKKFSLKKEEGMFRVQTSSLCEKEGERLKRRTWDLSRRGRKAIFFSFDGERRRVEVRNYFNLGKFWCFPAREKPGKKNISANCGTWERWMHNVNPANIASVHLVMGFLNPRSGVQIVNTWRRTLMLMQMKPYFDPSTNYH